MQSPCYSEISSVQNDSMMDISLNRTIDSYGLRVTLLFSMDERVSAQTINQQRSLLQSSLIMIWMPPHLSFHPNLTVHLTVKVHQNYIIPYNQSPFTPQVCPPASCHATSMHHSPVIYQDSYTCDWPDTQNATPTPLLSANGHILSCWYDTGRDINRLG